MNKTNISNLRPKATTGAKIISLEPDGWRLEIPPGVSGRYRLAQLDDYTALPRSKFFWHPPASISLEARASSNQIPGTWGFGLWNDPFGISVGLQGGSRKLPTLPNCAWFFIASLPNYLSIHDHVPGEGNLAGVFISPHIPGIFFAPALVLLPLFVIPPISRLFRKQAGRIVRQDAVQFSCNLEEWHEYRIEWQTSGVSFFLDDRKKFETFLSPEGPLGLVIWIDNQFAFWTPDGKIGMGMLKNPQPAWIELRDLLLVTT